MDSSSIFGYNNRNYYLCSFNKEQDKSYRTFICSFSKCKAFISVNCNDNKFVSKSGAHSTKCRKNFSNFNLSKKPVWPYKDVKFNVESQTLYDKIDEKFEVDIKDLVENIDTLKTLPELENGLQFAGSKSILEKVLNELKKEDKIFYSNKKISTN